MIIIAPNKNYNGESAGVQFRNGTGITNNERAIEWFKEKGYKVVEKQASDGENQNENTPPNEDKPLTEAILKKKSLEVLKKICEEKGIVIPEDAKKDEVIALILNSVNQEAGE